MPVPVGDEDHERHRGQRDRGQAGLEQEHGHRSQQDGDQRLSDEDQSVPEEEADGLQVHRGSGHQLPGLLAIEEGQLEALKLTVEGVAQVELDTE